MPVNVCLLGSRPFVFLSVLYKDPHLILQPGKVDIGKTCLAKVTAGKKKKNGRNRTPIFLMPKLIFGTSTKLPLREKVKVKVEVGLFAPSGAPP